MPIYRITVRLAAPLGTPLVGPTLFGQICWVLRERDGEAALLAWLDEPARAFVVSDGFPHGFLPRPLVHPRALPPDEISNAKERKKRGFVRRETWLSNRQAWDETALTLDHLTADKPQPKRLAHNQVHRSGRGTLEEGGLYFLEEDWRFSAGPDDGASDPALMDIYVETADPADRVAEIFTELGERGYGRDASTGRGRWTVEGSVEADSALSRDAGPRRMSLSRGVIDPETMVAPLWRLEPHFGRAGPQIALAGVSPFKRPVLLTRPGMTFTPVGQGPWGRMLDGIHADRPEIRLNARHIAIPFAEAKRGPT